MTSGAPETTRVHTRLLKVTLEADNARAYWSQVREEGGPVSARRAFEERWFGRHSLARCAELLTSFRARFDAFPPALDVLGAWTAMDPGTRRLVCHWHLQLCDPLYRGFTGRFLVERWQQGRAQITIDLTAAWVGEQGPGRWAASTRLQLASKLLSAAFSAGLVASRRDPRPLAVPRVAEEALTYLIFLLREVTFAGSLLDNPYLASVGLAGDDLEDRLRTLPALRFRRQGTLVDFGWQYDGLRAWAFDTVARAAA